MALDVNSLVRRLETLVDESSLEVDGGRILTPAEPVDLDPLVEPLFPGYEPGEWDPLYVMFTEDEGVDSSSLLGFEWDDGEAPISWSATIEQLRVGDRAYLIIPPDEDLGHRWQAVAAVEPADHRAAWGALIEELLATGGSAYGVELFMTWPTGLSNDASRLVDQAALERARLRFHRPRLAP